MRTVFICAICVICRQTSDVFAATWLLDPPRAEIPAEAAGGDEIVLRPGLYLGPITIPNRLAGTQDAPTVVRPQTPGTVTIIGIRPPGDALRIGTECAYPDGCHWVIVEDLELCWSKRDGLRGYGSDCIVRRCHIHRNGIREVAPGEGRIAVPVGQGVAWFGDQRDVQFIDNLVHDNGSSLYDHGFYCYGRRHVFEGNTVRDNAGSGLNLYERTSGAVIRGNLLMANGGWGAYVRMRDNEPTCTIANNVIAFNGREGLALIDGGGPAEYRPLVKDNWVFANAGGVVGWGGTMVPFVVATRPAEE